MSFHVFFSFSAGLKNPLQIPLGTKAKILAHVAHVEQTLGIKRSKYKDNPERWDTRSMSFEFVSDKILCQTVEDHNRWVEWLYGRLKEWSEKPVADGETLTPEDAAQFWPGLERITIPPERWTADYYRDRMESLYEVMRGRESEGITFDADPLTTEQAAAVIRIFDQYLDPADLRLDVPDGHDYLASSYDGGYHWCGECGKAIAPGDECGKEGCELVENDDDE